MLDWASSFRDGRGFLLELVHDGSAQRVEAGTIAEPLARRELVDSAKASGARYIFDPFDVPEYAWLEWAEMPRDALERLVGEPLGARCPPAGA